LPRSAFAGSGMLCAVTHPAGSDRIYHVTFASDWTDAQSTGEYRLSTRGTRLDEVGYIHASFAHQVRRIGTAVYGDASERLVVLAIDPALLSSVVTVENLDGGTEGFPHIYGPLPTSAVVEVLPASVDGGEFVVAGLAPGA
jgi:uncharacterized protein (DUF952 family)